MSVSGVGHDTSFTSISNVRLQQSAGGSESTEKSENDADSDDRAAKAASVTSAQATGGILGSRMDIRA